MGPNQRKTILVLLDLLDGNLPALDAVTLLAIGAELALVNVGVTVGALGRNVGKYRLGVALSASDFLVHATKRVTGLVVVELRNAADGFPAAEGMAILAGDVQVSVRAASVGRGLRVPGHAGKKEQ